MADYKVLSQEQQDDSIVAYVGGQEADLVSHQTSMNIYNDVLAKCDTDPDFASTIVGKDERTGITWTIKTKYEELRKQTLSRITEVQVLMEASKKQLPSDERIESSKARLTLKK